jgi:hypothetical protein
MDASLYYAPKVLRTGELKEAFEQAVAAALAPNAVIEVSHPRKTLRAGVSDSIQLDSESLRAIVDLSKISHLTLTARVPRSDSRTVYLGCSNIGGLLHVYAVGEVSVECLERLALNLGLEQTEAPKNDYLERLELRVSALEESAKAVERTLRCFISFKFDDAATVTQVDRLKRLMSAVHIEWVTGEQFEPRRIEDKVKAKLRADVNFVVAVISKAGESKWIRDEFGDANARGLPIVLLLERGATFDEGIFGTLEYIPYELVIDQTFAALLEGINFIKAEMSSPARNVVDPIRP